MEFLRLYGIWLLTFFVGFPLALDLVPPNRFYGYRNRKTLSDREVWRKANVFSGRVMMGSAVIGALILYRLSPISNDLNTLLLAFFLTVDVVISSVYVSRL